MQGAGDRPTLSVDIRRKGYQSERGLVEAVRDLAFEVRPAETLCLMGPSGCGKTTTLRILLGIDREFDGRIAPDPSEASVGIVFQEPRLLPWRDVETNIRLALARTDRERPLDDLLRNLGLTEWRTRYPGELSLGMARRVALARALAVEPSLLVLDEPFVSLDDYAAAELRQVLFGAAHQLGCAVLMVTHDLEEALAWADRIVLLTPRPATKLAEIAVGEPREARDRAWAAGMRARLAEAYPAAIAA